MPSGGPSLKPSADRAATVSTWLGGCNCNVNVPDPVGVDGEVPPLLQAPIKRGSSATHKPAARRFTNGGEINP